MVKAIIWMAVGYFVIPFLLEIPARLNFGRE